MTKYEIMFIVKATMEEDKIKAVSDELQKLINKKPSKVIEFKEMGRKKLAYPINKEFDRKVLINENLIRNLIIKVEGE